MITMLSTTLHFWLKQPILSASLGLLIVVLALGGPAACVMHCVLLDALHHHQVPQLSHQHHEMGTRHDSGLPTCPSSDQHTQHSEHAEPSALTIAIVLPLMLLPQLLTESLRLLLESLRGLSIVLRPPRRPPRLTHS